MKKNYIYLTLLTIICVRNIDAKKYTFINSTPYDVQMQSYNGNEWDRASKQKREALMLIRTLPKGITLSVEIPDSHDRIYLLSGTKDVRTASLLDLAPGTYRIGITQKSSKKGQVKALVAMQEL